MATQEQVDGLRDQLAKVETAIKDNWLAGGDPERGRRLEIDRQHLQARLRAAQGTETEDG